MKQKYKEKIELINNLLKYDEKITKEEDEKRFDQASNLMKELIVTRDSEALYELLDVFTEENEDCGEICETLMSQISANYTEKQKFNALCKKFSVFVENDLMRCCIMISWFFYEEYFEQFREVFNKTKSKYSKQFLEEVSDWIPCGTESYISVLKEDMKKW